MLKINNRSFPLQIRQPAVAFGRVFFFLAASVLFGSCAFQKQVIAPHSRNEFQQIQNGPYRIYLSKNLPQNQIDFAHDFIFQTGNEVRSLFFSTKAQRLIHIVVYSTSEQYNQTRSGKIPSMGHYDRSKHAIHISYEALRSYLKHEMTHAVLESSREKAPFWLHEGLAYLIHSNELKGPVDCKNLQKVRIAPVFRNYIHIIRSQKTPPIETELDYADQDTTIESTVTAVYFTHFLWKKQRLSATLHEYLHNEDQPTLRFILTDGNLDRWQSLLKDFQTWSKTEEPLLPLNGC